MIDAYTLNQWLSRFTYKPGWKFKVRADFLDMKPELHVSFLAKDAANPTEKLDVIQMTMPLELVESYEDFKRYLIVTIHELEEHEIKEWFREDGVCVRDPHPELKRKQA